jgi:hypothetical protein
MGLLLPVLLLGLLPPADQPTSAANNQAAVRPQTTLVASQPTKTNNAPQADGRSQQQPFDRIEPFLDKPAGTPDLCLTMRSYYFERQDDLAPEFKGMTTCESARDVRNRNTKKGLKPKLVPATSAPAN